MQTPKPRSWTTALTLLSFGLATVLGCQGLDNGPGATDFGGQSGGEYAVPAICPCVPGGSALAAYGTVEHSDACGVRVLIDEILGGADRAAVEVGDTVEGTPAACVDPTGFSEGDEVFVLYAPAPMPAAPEPGDAHVSIAPGSIFVSQRGEPIRVDRTDEGLASNMSDIQETIAILLDSATCEAWAAAHTPAPPVDQSEPSDPNHPEGDGEQLDAGQAFPADPDDVIVPADPPIDDNPIDDEEIDDEEGQPACAP